MLQEKSIKENKQKKNKLKVCLKCINGLYPIKFYICLGTKLNITKKFINNYLYFIKLTEKIIDNEMHGGKDEFIFINIENIYNDKVNINASL